MNDFNPGDGWREITYQESVNGRRYLREHGDDGVPTHTWVREEPVPPLPTEPNTVIRVKWRDSSTRSFLGSRLLLDESGAWMDGDDDLDAVDVARRITGFEVLAQPMTRIQALWHDMLVRERRETAKAVLDRIAEIDDIGDGIAHDQVAREFGVEVSS